MSTKLAPVTKLVVPVAGYGTRSLPFTKALPKVMLPLVDKPGVQYIVEEAVKAGIREITFVTSSNQHSIEDHFDYYWELEEKLKESGKLDLLEQVRAVSDLAHFTYTRQKEQLGNAHAVLQAQPIVGQDPFCVQFGDDIVLAGIDQKPFLQQMIDVYEATDADCVIATFDTDDTGAKKYAIVETYPENGHFRATSIIEKPGPEKTKSRLASVAGFLFKPTVFDYIKQLNPDLGAGGEYVLADAIRDMIADQKKVYASHIQGRRIDIGNKLLYMIGCVEQALEHPEIKDDFAMWLKSLKIK